MMLKLPSLPLFGLNLLSIFIRCLKDFRRFFMFCVWWDFIEFKKSSNAEKIIDFVIKSEKLRIITWNLRHEAIRVIQCEWWVKLEILMKGRRRRLTVRWQKIQMKVSFFSKYWTSQFHRRSKNSHAISLFQYLTFSTKYLKSQFLPSSKWIDRALFNIIKLFFFY